MDTIIGKEFGGERSLYGARNIRLDGCTIHTGESALKECAGIEAHNCRFEGKYPLWHVDGMTLEGCTVDDTARAPLWYSRSLLMTDSAVGAPKPFREMTDIRLRRVRMTDTTEAFWYCHGIDLEDVEASGAEYMFMHSSDIHLTRCRMQGNYSFQYCRNVTIRDSEIHTKDAFWESEDVTVFDSVIDGQYLGWHSRRLRLIRCHIKGTQPLCYADDLVLEHCTFDADADLAFEHSQVRAQIDGAVTSVKNPRSGYITAGSIGTLILDDEVKSPADCIISTAD